MLVAASVILRAAGSINSPNFGIVVPEVLGDPCVLHRVDFRMCCGVKSTGTFSYFCCAQSRVGGWLPKAPLFAHLQNGPGKYKFIEMQNC